MQSRVDLHPSGRQQIELIRRDKLGNAACSLARIRGFPLLSKTEAGLILLELLRNELHFIGVD